MPGLVWRKNLKGEPKEKFENFPQNIKGFRLIQDIKR
jgi:hypothetical protein